METKRYTEEEIIKMLQTALNLARLVKPTLTVPTVVNAMRTVIRLVNQEEGK